MSNLRLSEGLGSFVFSSTAAGTRPSIRVFYFCPGSPVRDAHIVIAMHGFDRAASEFRDVLVDQAKRTGQIVLVSEHHNPGGNERGKYYERSENFGRYAEGRVHPRV